MNRTSVSNYEEIPSDYVHDAVKFKSARQLLEAGRETITLTNSFLAKFEALETAGDDLMTVLDEAGIVIALETDTAFETGFTGVAVIGLAVLVVVTLFGYMVSREIAGPIQTSSVSRSSYSRLRRPRKTSPGPTISAPAPLLPNRSRSTIWCGR